MTTSSTSGPVTPAGAADEGRPTVAVVGGGVMGEALLHAVLTAGWAPEQVEVVERAVPRADELAGRYGVRTGATTEAAAARADVVLLAVKPDVVPAVLATLAPVLRGGTLVVSVAAGVPLATYEKALPTGTPVVRVMPNTPAVVGKGASAIAAGTSAHDGHLELTERLLAATGLVVRVPEKQLDAVTAISGSGPAYAFYLIDAMAEAGVLLGLSRDLATRLAAATVEGAGALAASSGEHPAVLRERVSSPGGTTVAAVAQLDAHAVRAGVVAAARAAHDRSVELGKA
ncbi:pyrroline-5-carboxylate reductase [Cellulomonas sp. HZM]|uniref:pyrroline-5-carboxylate reductase n=1 Tax=Cellulomonas sp. HZM TaxID=1454010 RepID=UPI0009DF5346|nr:pyrroline-5-carboxylate reductase [Cellulomonas sp. HZM]